MTSENTTLLLGFFWGLCIVSSALLGVFRSYIDRVRSGLAGPPTDESRSSRQISHALDLPNHERPLHLEAAVLSSLQVVAGLYFLKSLVPAIFSPWTIFFLAALLSIIIERVTGWLYPRKISQSNCLEAHLAMGFLPILLTRALCSPLGFGLRTLETLLQNSDQKILKEKDEESDLADHIKMVGREGTNLDPDVLEIMENTLEMSHLKVKDVMIPRNQVQILDANEEFEENLRIAKSCGHTRLPLCNGDLDHCLGIIHVKYAFRTLVEETTHFDFKKITRSPALLDGHELLPVALKKMMKLKVHMALVKDEFGGIDGVITLEDILEEVVGEIQDEFDADEEAVETISETEWKISGLTPLHELPDALDIQEEDQEMTSLSGMITREIGKIPEAGEKFSLSRYTVEILDADETKVRSVKIKLNTEDPG